MTLKASINFYPFRLFKDFPFLILINPANQVVHIDCEAENISQIKALRLASTKFG
jgi:hypothetical protein